MDSPFVQRLLIAVPELRGVYDSHLSNYDELLPYVFMGDVTRAVIEQSACESSNINRKSLLDFFEQELNTQNSEADDLIHLGFCENLQGEHEVQNVLAPDMGPLLFEKIKRFS